VIWIRLPAKIVEHQLKCGVPDQTMDEDKGEDGQDDEPDDGHRIVRSCAEDSAVMSKHLLDEY
jgi:hypothetical protein